jgi:hypothetical protein
VREEHPVADGDAFTCRFCRFLIAMALERRLVAQPGAREVITRVHTVHRKLSVKNTPRM